MATPQYSERKAAVLKNNTTKILWYLILILTVVSAANSIYGLATFSTTQAKLEETLRNANANQNTNAPISIEAIAQSAANFALGALILGLILEVLIFWGVYRLERWVRWVLWIFFGLSILSFNVFSIVLTLLWALAYQRVYKEAITPSPSTGQAPAA